jgi:D-alanyl-lipoteichoic acid acyltransferase DltB (MBOAT superfamily)
MIFNSLNYFLFLPLVFLAYHFSRDSFRWLLLLAASIAFYATLKVPHLIVVLLLVIAITYFTGIGIDRSASPPARRRLLWGGICANLLILVLLKYLPFLTQNLNVLLKQVSPGIVVPVSRAIVSIGVSYYVFQAISYLVDIYLEVEKPERHFGLFALHMSFFPKLLQGPIERGGDLLPQLRQPYRFDYDNARSGLLLFAWGLFKKVVVADRLAQFVNPVYDNVHAHQGLALVVATYCFSFQIYCDFSGYTDMALGSARLFNIRLTQNFSTPYFATSIADFWRRWHISFSRWILDYIFRPLQMSLRDWRTAGTALALVVTFLISGLWHGATWTFIVWGGVHGFMLAASVISKPVQKSIHKSLGIEKSGALKLFHVFVTFHLVSFAWIFFRTGTLVDSFYVIRELPHGLVDLLQGKIGTASYVGVEGFVRAIACIATVLVVDFIQYTKRDFRITDCNVVTRWAVYCSLLLAIMFFSVYDNNKFIYLMF